MIEQDHAVARQQTGSRPAWQTVAPLLIICLAGLGVMLPFLLKPYATQADDALHHLFRLFALDQALSQGDAYPLRFPEFSYGYGAAVLSYYPLLSYYLMEAWHLLGADYVLAYKVAFTCIALGAALSSYYLAERIFGRPAAVVVSVAYLYNPYFLTNIWRRAAAAEALALAVAPLLFAAIHRVASETSWRSYVEASVAVALIILAHPLSTFLFAPFLAGYTLLAVLLLGRGRRWRAVTILGAGVVTGALVTCFYWLPAQLEPGGRRAVDLAATVQAFMESLKPIGHALRLGWTTVFRIESTLPDFSIVVFMLLVMSLIYFVFTLRRRDIVEKAQFAFFAISAVAAFLAVTNWARPLWERLTPIAYLQFPFRWFGPWALFAALTTGGSFRLDLPGRLSQVYRYAVGILLLFVVVTSLRNAPLIPEVIPSAAVPKVTSADIHELGKLAYEHDEADYFANHGCWVWVNEYIPSTSFLSDCPRYLGTMLENAPVRSGLPSVKSQVIPTAAGPNLLEAVVKSAEPWRLSLHAFWIPGWSATVDGKPALAVPTDAIGVAGVEVPAGEHRVRLAFGPTPLRRVTVWVSLLALGAWLFIAWRRHWRLAAAVTVVLVLMAGLVGGRALAAPKSPNLTPVQIDLGGKIGLEGYAFGRQGDKVDVRLLWLARQPMAESYKVFIHVIDDQGRLLAQVDSRPLNYADNTNRWLPGQVTYDQFEVPLPAETPSGRYQVRVGLYNEADGQRLPVLDASGQAVDNQILLGEMTVP